MRFGLPLLLLLLLAPLAVAPLARARAGESAPVTTPRGTVTLISETDTVMPGTPYRVALRLRMAPGWHIYWRNPGDSGLPPELEFTLPPGVTAGEIAWPTPTRQPELNVMTYGYTGEVILPVALSGGPGAVVVKANWLICEKICIPEDGAFTLALATGPPRPSAEAALFAAADARMPRPAPWPARIAPDFTLSLAGDDLPTVTDAWFMPFTPDAIAASAPQRLTTTDGRLTLALTPASAFRPDTPLAGLIVLRDRTGADTALTISATPGPVESTGSLWRILLFALLGGLVLNLMPCVFPILAMKAVALAGLAGQDRRQARMHALTYAAGVLATFTLMAFLLLALRHAGNAVGWGFQFQSPLFVATMAVALFAIGLNFSGLYAIGGAIGAGQSLSTRKGHAGSLFSGMLAVLVATPCTAPFMGAAITAGLAGSALTTFAVFAALGAGLALPYVLFASIPALARTLPRPGRWMDLLKQFLAFPMYGASAWLIWVLSLQAGAPGVLAAGIAIVLTGFSLWALGLAQQGIGKWVPRGLAVLALAGALAALAGTTEMAPVTQVDAGQAEAGIEPLTPARLASLRAEGRPVFVNVTAAWCVVCLVNEQVALRPEAVRRAFADRGITYLKGDWTRPDKEISAYLRANNSDGVPLYVFYPAGQRPPVILPQLLTPAIVLAAISGG